MSPRTRNFLVLAAVAVLGVAVVLIARRADDPAIEANVPPAETETIFVPELTPAAITGHSAFVENCARCHGANGGGTDQGPPLIHPIYEPGHHSDLAFVLAARNGSRAHHWRFGDMPPQPQVTEEQIAAIIQFVREVQRANGIF